ALAGPVLGLLVGLERRHGALQVPGAVRLSLVAGCVAVGAQDGAVDEVAAALEQAGLAALAFHPFGLLPRRGVPDGGCHQNSGGDDAHLLDSHGWTPAETARALPL